VFIIKAAGSLRATPLLLSSRDDAGKYYENAGTASPDGAPPQRDATLVDVGALAELAAGGVAAAGDDALAVGASVTVTELIAVLDASAGASSASAASDGAHKPVAMTSVAAMLARHLGRVASTQVRNVATWAGNLCLARAAPAFGSDVLTAFAAAGVTLTLAVADASAADGYSTVEGVAVADFCAGATPSAADAPFFVVLGASVPLGLATAATNVIAYVFPSSRAAARGSCARVPPAPRVGVSRLPRPERTRRRPHRR